MVRSVAATTVLFFVVSCRRAETVVVPPTIPSPPPVATKVEVKLRPRPPRPNFSSSWQTESEYIITRIASQLSDDVIYAGARTKTSSAQSPRLRSVQVQDLTPTDHRHPSFRVSVEFDGADKFECDVSTAMGIFAVETYLPLTHKIAEHLKVALRPEVEKSPADLATTLLNLRVDSLVDADTALSTKLKEHFTDVGLHEQAALLIEAFSWRDASGQFFNLLPELNRITAHRVFAAALRKRVEPSNDLERLTLALADELVGLQRDALTEAEKLSDQLPWSAWSRTIRMRSTQDYRIFLESHDSSLLERLEWYRVFASAMGSDPVQKSFTIPAEWQEMPDWWRFLNRARPSVETGHLLSEKSIQCELAEAKTVFAKYPSNHGGSNILIERLNAPENDGFATEATELSPEIIGWSLWAQFMQRHLCTALCDEFYFFDQRWGVPEQARRFRVWADDTCKGLTLYPFVRRVNATSEVYYHEAQDAALVLVRKAPELCPALVWNEMSYRTNFGALYVPAPHPFINEWHFDNPLPGTAYDLTPRVHHPSMTGRADIQSVLRDLKAAAPNDDAFLYFILTNGWMSEPSAATAIDTYGKLTETHPYLDEYIAGLYAKERDPKDQEVWLNKAALLKPGAYRQLGELYVEQKRNAEAAHAFEQWIANESDEVSIANQSEWLVNYYEDHGSSRAATLLAKRCAEVYSAKGLLTQARLFERRKKYEDALSIYDRESERYDDPGCLIGFLMRHQTRAGEKPLEPDLLNHLLETYFPGGPKVFKAEGFMGPVEGVQVPPINYEMKRSGLETDDIIVAIRGYVVTDWSHFRIIRAFEAATPYDAVVWRKHQLVTVKAIPGDRRFGIDLITYHGYGSSPR